MNSLKCWDTPWPYSDLASVNVCPVCGCGERNLLYRDLVDNAFFIASGRWDMYQCESCRSAYLDPRPTESSIHKAYGVYYTHRSITENRVSLNNLGFLRRIRRMLSNGYYNYHFGTKRKPEIRIGRWLLVLWPGFHSKSKANFRFVGKPSIQGNRLLDVGCGNGDFLSLASEVGWLVKGVEPDGKAIAVARSRGLEVLQGGIEKISTRVASFDVVTISHVIEHVYDPSTLLKNAYEILKPGGTLYIETPNIEGYGAKIYCHNWRGLEAPRHLMIFSKEGLTDLILRQGFQNLQFKSRHEMTKNIALKSYRMQQGKSPYSNSPKRLPLLHRLKLIYNRAYGDEFLTVVAQKP